MKILSNKKYKELEQAKYNATLYYNECETLRKRKEQLVKEKNAFANDICKLEEKCRNYKKQIEEYELNLKELNEQIRILKGQVTRAKNKIKNTKNTFAKKGK